MQQKTEGRLVRLLSKHLAAEDRAVEQWFLVAIADDEKAKEAISKFAKGGNEVVEVIGNIPASKLASWSLTDGEVRLVLPGEPVTESQ
jgi:TusA-related sulfurtransferase